MPAFSHVLVVALGALAILWIAPIVVEALSDSDGYPELDLAAVSRPYLAISASVFLDAIIPIFPSESLLNAASTLASQDRLDLGPIVLAAALGAIFGDSALYWLSRTLGRRVIGGWLEKVTANPTVATSFEMLSQNAPLLIVAGRYVPGMRFAVSASMGLGRYPYPRFLLWSAIGGVTWAAYTCLLAFWVGTKLGEYPVVSILSSALITTGILALLYRPLKRRWAQAEQAQARTGPEKVTPPEAPGPLS